MPTYVAQMADGREFTVEAENADTARFVATEHGSVASVAEFKKAADKKPAPKSTKKPAPKKASSKAKK